MQGFGYKCVRRTREIGEDGITAEDSVPRIQREKWKRVLPGTTSMCLSLRLKGLAGAWQEFRNPQACSW